MMVSEMIWNNCAGQQQTMMMEISVCLPAAASLTCTCSVLQGCLMSSESLWEERAPVQLSADEVQRSYSELILE